ncbi:hypothetical protein LTR92_011794, partial [Exophiala xenobiotica]
HAHPIYTCNYIAPENPRISTAMLMKSLVEYIRDPVLKCERFVFHRENAEIKESERGDIIGYRWIFIHTPTVEAFQGRELHLLQRYPLSPFPSFLLIDRSLEARRSSAQEFTGNKTSPPAQAQ